MDKKANQLPRLGSYDYVLYLSNKKRGSEDEIKFAVDAAHEAGDKRATYALAMGHLQGVGGYIKNLKKAVSYLREAAVANISWAHFDLAVCYEKGEGVRKSEKLAYLHYLAAALNGDNDAVVEVGRCLHYGIGIQRDRKAAEVWFKKADTLGIEISKRS